MEDCAPWPWWPCFGLVASLPRRRAGRARGTDCGRGHCLARPAWQSFLPVLLLW